MFSWKSGVKGILERNGSEKKPGYFTVVKNWYILDALRDWVPFVQYKKREKHLQNVT